MNEQKDINTELGLLYEKWPEVKLFLKSKGCGATNAEDIFQEALLIYIRKLKAPDFILDVEPIFYVKNTCKFLWYNQSRKESKHRTEEFTENFAEENDDWMIKEMKLKRIEGAISQIGKQCQDILKMFYGLGLNMIEIAKKVGLRNDKVAKSQKYRCINKVKDIIAQTKPINESL